MTTKLDRGTDAQILTERKLTCEAVDGAIAFGYQNTNAPPSDDHWLAPYWKIGRKQAELERTACTNCGLSVDPHCGCSRGRALADTMTTYTDRQKACIQALHDAIFDKCLMDLSDDECAGILAYLESTSPVAGFSVAIYQTKLKDAKDWRDTDRETYEHNATRPERMDTRIVYASYHESQDLLAGYFLKCPASGDKYIYMPVGPEHKGSPNVVALYLAAASQPAPAEPHPAEMVGHPQYECADCNKSSGHAAPTPVADSGSTFEWPALPDLPTQFACHGFDPMFSAHQMQGYANAYGEIVRAALAAAKPVSVDAGGMTERPKYSEPRRLNSRGYCVGCRCYGEELDPCAWAHAQNGKQTPPTESTGTL